jgi:putative spermidine/putrescine transport system permease protein
MYSEMTKASHKYVSLAYTILVIAYLLFPIFIMIPVSFSGSDLLQFPPRDLSFRWYYAYFSEKAWIDATLLSMKIGALSSILATTVGVLAAISLDRGAFKMQGAIVTLITAPIIIPSVFIALGLFVVALRFNLQGSQILVTLAHATISLPFVVLLVGSSLRQSDSTLERAARILGAGPVRAFFTAVFPRLIPAIAASCVIAFFTSFDELIISQFILTGVETLPMRIWANVRFDISPTIAAVSSLLAVVTIVALVGAELLRRQSER